MPFPLADAELDFRPLLGAMAERRRQGRTERRSRERFTPPWPGAVADAGGARASAHGLDTVVCSGGVFQNGCCLPTLKAALESTGLTLWTNHAVPPNDGGISLGQAAIAAFHPVGRPQ